EHAEVLGIEPGSDDVVVRTAAGDVGARVAVIAAGSWAGPLLDGLAAIPLTPVLQQISYYPAPSDVRLPTFIDWSGPDLSWYAVPPAREAAGVKVGQHVGGRAVDPGAGPFEPDP